MADGARAQFARVEGISDDGIVTVLTCVGRSGLARGLACELRTVCKQLDSNLRNSVLNTAASESKLFWDRASILVLTDIIRYGTATISFDATVALCERRAVDAAVEALLAIDVRRPNCACHQPGEHPSPAEKRGINAAMLQRVFRRCCKAGTCGLDIFKLLLADARIDPANDNDSAIRCSSCNGHLDFVQALMADERVNPVALTNDAIRFAAENGHVEVVNLLLTDGRVDPGADDNYALRWASAYGHSDVVRRLLVDERVNPGALDNAAVIAASKNGHTEVLRVLLADPRTDPSARDSEAIWLACAIGRLAAATVLLADARVDPAARNNACICIACCNGHHLVVRLLLGDQRVDPAADHNNAVVCAVLSRHPDTLRELLADPRVNPSALDNAALTLAVERGDELVTILLDDQRVDLSGDTIGQILLACGRVWLSTLRVILSHHRIDADMMMKLLTAAVHLHARAALPLLLNHPKADLSRPSDLMFAAYKHSADEVWQMLLDHPQLMAACAGAGTLLAQMACISNLPSTGRIERLQSLLANERIPLNDPATDPGCRELLSIVVQNGDLATLRALLEVPRLQQQLQVSTLEAVAATAERAGRADIAQLLRSRVEQIATHAGK